MYPRPSLALIYAFDVLILDLRHGETCILATRSISWASSSRLQIAGNDISCPLHWISLGEDMLGSLVRRVARSRNRSARLKLASSTSARRVADRGCVFQFSTFL